MWRILQLVCMYICCTAASRLHLSSVPHAWTWCHCISQVRVGSLSDPPGLDGLAHFTEHMLFYGSERYPEEDAYSK